MSFHDPGTAPAALVAAPAPSKWSKTFWSDLGERVGTTAIYGLAAVLTGDATGAVPNDPKVWWTVIGLPTVLALLKGLAANMANPASGPSLLPAPPAPEVPEAEPVQPEVPNPPVIKKAAARKAPAKKAAAKKAAPKSKGLS